MFARDAMNHFKTASRVVASAPMQTGVGGRLEGGVVAVDKCRANFPPLPKTTATGVKKAETKGRGRGVRTGYKCGAQGFR